MARLVIEGEREYEVEWEFTRGGLVCNVAYFCPSCGQIWARLRNGAQHWMTLGRGCRAHPQSGLTPAGSILLPWKDDPLAGLPPALVAREFLLLSHHQGTS